MCSSWIEGYNGEIGGAFLLQYLLFIHRVEPTQLAFVILGASMAALALMILVTAILATGATRVKVYKSSVGRVGGRVASACFIFIT